MNRVGKVFVVPVLGDFNFEFLYSQILESADVVFYSYGEDFGVLDEMDFRARSKRIDPSKPLVYSDTCFLALNYIIFACVDITSSMSTTRYTEPGRPVGWQWFQRADDLIEKKKLTGRGDMSLLQAAIFQVYLSALICIASC